MQAWPCRSFGDRGISRPANYAGAPTTANRRGGPAGMATMSCASWWPARMPPSDPWATMSIMASSVATSSLTPGYSARKRTITGLMTSSAALRGTFKRSGPVGRPRNALTLYMASAMSPRAGPIRRVFGSDGGHVGTVDHVEEDRIKLTKQDAPSGRALHHYYLPVSAVAAVDGREVRLNMDAYRAREPATMTSATEPTRGMESASIG